MATQQEDGFYPRVNSSMLQNCDGKIVSLIGSLVSFDGTNMTLKSADGGDVRVLVSDPNSDHQQVCAIWLMCVSLCMYVFRNAALLWVPSFILHIRVILFCRNPASNLFYCAWSIGENLIIFALVHPLLYVWLQYYLKWIKPNESNEYNQYNVRATFSRSLAR